MLSLQNICKIYDKGGVVALDHVNLHIAVGEYLSIAGQSGSGKTTLMHILGCLDRPTSGCYRLHGEDVSHLQDGALSRVRGREIGFIFQNFCLMPNQSALDNVALPLLFQGVSLEERQSRATDALCMVGLGSRLHHKPHMLSGGQQQRVAIARALCTNPHVLLADEPTGNLDPQAAHEVLALFDRLHAAGRTIVLITHDPKAAQRASRQVRIADGKIVAQ